MKINLHSIYDNPSFTAGRTPEFLKWVHGDGELDCYVDSKIRELKIPEKSIALLIEPRSIQPSVYEYIEKNSHKFRFVFTHDSILLNSLDNAKLILFGGVYDEYNESKTKDISIVSSDKEMCALHIKRKQLCRELLSNPKVDCYGTFDGGAWGTTKDIYASYKYSIVIENYIDDYWFTEKICNCFANRTIPIYCGARRIGDYFNVNGIIQIDDPFQAIDVVNGLDVNKDYLTRLSSVIYNHELVKRFLCFEDWFHAEYKELLEEMINE